MPIYEYFCENCETQFEKLLKMSEIDLPVSEPCPICNIEGKIETMNSTFALGDPIKMGLKRPDSGFGEVLSKIKQAHPKGNWGNKKFSPLGGR